MWNYEHQATTSAPPERLYSLWSHVETWHEWNDDLQRAYLHGPFAVNSTIDMVSAQGTLTLRLADVQEHEGFVDEVELDGLLFRTSHHLARLPGGPTQVTYRMEITGEHADQRGPEIGPQITGDFPDTVTALICHAER
ncbi:polyketide cyclase [Deinococcus ruber]|uniref:Polyketide cyclase n=1 Tax=Deinococcus ruber TaxID=1848197 RepID=A0A918FIA7_9DEIO|nr:polyketide cyclase [Deinococcus ruber]GGR39095.1 hypothetical protein GCM10008957_55030 [Deinococcus ruber]